MDIYTETTIKLMKEHKFDEYLKTMTAVHIPNKNLITLVYLKVQEFVDAANQEILKAASDRRAEQERKRNV